VAARITPSCAGLTHGGRRRFDTLTVNKRRPYSSDRHIFDFLFSGYLVSQRLIGLVSHFPENVSVYVIMTPPCFWHQSGKSRRIMALLRAPRIIPGAPLRGLRVRQRRFSKGQWKVLKLMHFP